jgi:hypothetical protein
MLPVILSFGAIDALVPLIIIIILIAAAGGLTRGFDMLKFFGIETLAGIGMGAAAKGSLLRKTAFTKKAGQALVGKGGKTTGKLFSPGKAAASKINRRIARNAAFEKELEALGVKYAGKKQSRLLNMLKGFAVKLGGPAVKAGRVVAPVSVLGGVAGAKAVAAGTRAGIRALRGRRGSRQKVNVTNLGKVAGPTPFSDELNELKNLKDLQEKLANRRRALARSAVKEDRMRIKKEISELEKKLGKMGNELQMRVTKRRVNLLQEGEPELQAARARFLQTGDIGEYRKEFNKLWDKTHKGEPSLLRSVITIAGATPGIIRSSSDERRARIQALNERLEERMAATPIRAKDLLKGPDENAAPGEYAPMLTLFSIGGINRLSAFHKLIGETISNARGKLAKLRKRNTEESENEEESEK